MSTNNVWSVLRHYNSHQRTMIQILFMLIIRNCGFVELHSIDIILFINSHVYNLLTTEEMIKI